MLKRKKLDCLPRVPLFSLDFCYTNYSPWTSSDMLGLVENYRFSGSPNLLNQHLSFPTIPQGLKTHYGLLRSAVYILL